LLDVKGGDSQIPEKLISDLGMTDNLDGVVESAHLSESSLESTPQRPYKEIDESNEKIKDAIKSIVSDVSLTAHESQASESDFAAPSNQSQKEQILSQSLKPSEEDKKKCGGST